MSTSSSTSFPVESWRYTKGEVFLHAQREMLSEDTSRLQDLPKEILILLSEFPQKLVFYNGDYVPHLSTFPLSVIRSQLEAKRELENPLDFENLKSKGYEISLVADRPNSDLAVVCLYGNRLNRDTKVFGTNSRNSIHVSGQGALRVLEFHIAINEIEFYANNALFTHLAPDVTCERLRYFWVGRRAYFYDRSEAVVAAGATLKNVTVVTGGKWTRFNERDELQGSNAQIISRHLTMLGDQQSSDLASRIVHQVGKTISDQTHKAMVTGKSKSTFTGNLNIAQDAQQSSAAQLSRNLVLDDHSEINTRPQLEILADDVKAKHGATVGQLQEDEIFYLQSRGIARSEARKLVAKGFALSILDTFENENLKTVGADCLSASLAQFMREANLADV